MRLDDYSYFLPEKLIAQKPLDDRPASRLMVVSRYPRPGGGPAESEPDTTHAAFRDLPAFLDGNDVLVINRSRVVRARLYAHRETGGRVEVLYVRKLHGDEFAAWLRPVDRLKPGEVLRGRDPRCVFRFLERTGDREGVLRVEAVDSRPVDIEDVLEAQGHVPLPPYIRRADNSDDVERYQTVYAREKGSVAAPTAGLHFDEVVIKKIKKRGVEIAPLVLHVGPGTFSPLESEEVEANRLSPEKFLMPAESITSIRNARRSGKRIVAVGTTVTRALESAHTEGWFDGEEDPAGRTGETSLFIYPGYEFGVVDRLITNFHLPQSSLLLLVCAFMGRERTLACYRGAVEQWYRFYSYGDAMFIR